MSPDGRRVAFAAASGGTTRVYVRRRDTFEASPLEGTDGASEPVFSPDGEWIAFFAGTKLNKVPASGGPVVPLATVNDPRGLSWDVGDRLTFAPFTTSGIEGIPAAGGAPAALTHVAAEKSERSHRWPQMLPDGAAVLFTVGQVGSPDDYSDANIDAAVLATGERRRLVTGALAARYVPTGHLVFARGRVLYAVRFDARTLTVSGSPVPILQGVQDDPTTGATHFSTSASGVLAYIAGDQGALRRLLWVSRDGTRTPVDLPAGGYLDPRLSPDGTRLAVRVIAGNTSDIWVHDIVGRTFTRLTFGGTNVSPVWSADGRTIYYVAMGSGDRVSAAVWRKPADGGGRPEQIAELPYRAYLGQVAADGRSAMVSYYLESGQSDIGILPLEGHGQIRQLVATTANEYAAALSPNRRFAAYTSGESGRAEVYVTDVTAPGVRWQVSTSGGEEARWSSDGRVLYYRAGTTFMATPVDTRESFRPGTPVPLFEGVYNFRLEAGLSYDVAPRSERFVMLTQTEDERSLTSARLVINWFEELRRTVGGP